MHLSISSLPRLAGDALTLPVRVGARAAGLVKGTVTVARDHVAPAAPATTWETADRVAPAAAEPAPVTLGHESGPVNVVEELGLDPAPPTPATAPPRQPAVTGIDQRAEPRLVQSTPADVARRISRSDDASGS